MQRFKFRNIGAWKGHLHSSRKCIEYELRRCYRRLETASSAILQKLLQNGSLQLLKTVESDQTDVPHRRCSDNIQNNLTIFTHTQRQMTIEIDRKKDKIILLSVSFFFITFFLKIQPKKLNISKFLNFQKFEMTIKSK